LQQIVKLVGAFVFAAALVAAESAFGASTGFGTIIPIQAHIFILTFVLLYLTFSVGEVRDRIDKLITLETARQPDDSAARQ
jgi:hypothetical protein